jgi:hypothetical protein
METENASTLLGIVYSEFDNHVGPIIRYLYPENILSKEHSEIISDFIVLEKHLCNEVISVNSGDYLHFLMICMNIDNKKYERNSFIFSFGFVLSSVCSCATGSSSCFSSASSSAIINDIHCFHRILKSLTTFFYDLELESDFLSNPLTKPKVYEILQLVYENLKENHSCFLSIENNTSSFSSVAENSAIPNNPTSFNSSNTGSLLINSNNNSTKSQVSNNSSASSTTSNYPSTASAVLPSLSPLPVTTNLPRLVNHFYLPLQLFSSPCTLSNIHDYDVPTFKNEKIQLSHLSYDISFRHIILYIDGVSHVKKIAKDVNMDIAFVKKTLSLLLYYDLIIMGDIFKFSNIYTFNYELLYSSSSLSSSSPSSPSSSIINDEMMNEIKEFACLEFQNPSSSSDSIEFPRNIDILLFLLKLQPKRNIGQVLVDSLIAVHDNDSTATSASESSSSAVLEQQHQGSSSVVRNHPLSSSSSPLPPQRNPPQHLQSLFYSLPLRNINIQRLLAICLSKGIIRRLYEYPIYLKPANGSSSSLPLSYSTASFPSSQSSLEQYGNKHTNNNSSNNLIEESSSSSGASSSSTTIPLPTSSSTIKHSKSSYLTGDLGKSSSINQDGGGEIPLSSSLPGISYMKQQLSSFPPSSQTTTTTPSSRKSINLQSNASNTLHQPGGSKPISREASYSSFPSNYFEPRPFGKGMAMTRGKSVLSQSYLKDQLATGGAGSTAGLIPSSSGIFHLEVSEIISSLDGNYHLDAICCKYEISYNDILKTPGIRIIYK